MSILPFFLPPAQQDDFKDPNQYQQFVQLWSTYVNGFTQQAILGNPWTATNTQYQDYYYNPLTTDVPSSSTAAAIQWSAFPGRINYYFPSLSQVDRWSLADTGYMTNGQTFPQITADPCATPPPPPSQAYGPYGPRGWQDEYCEWSVTRDATSKKITRVDFTCENPEYWRSLWQMDQKLVHRLYQETLNNPNIRLEDLYLVWNGAPVQDPSTGLPAYNPLNKWNLGTSTTSTSGGAMHLTSTPNTLQTETGLAGAATVQRTIGNSDPEALICCSQYGQPHRNSDPHIGQVTNQVVGAQLRASLTSPTGLYIQMPDFSRYKLPPNAPSGTQPGQFWKVVRGAASLNDQNGNPIPGNFFLHCVYEVPKEMGFTVGDIQIQASDGKYYNIQYGAQIAETFLMEINATPIPVSTPAPKLDCVGSPATPTPQPLQMMYAALWNAYYGTQVPNPVGFPMNLASNTVIIPPTVNQRQVADMVLTGLVTLGPNGELPTVSFPPPNGGPPDIQVVVRGSTNVKYAVPGNTYPSTCQALTLQLTVSANAQGGLRGVQIQNYGQQAGPVAPAFLIVGIVYGS